MFPSDDTLITSPDAKIVVTLLHHFNIVAHWMDGTFFCRAVH
jgi:hypothetical protein